MGNISGSINLTKLTHAIIKTKSGADAIVIPLEQNHLTKTEKGNVFLNLSAREYLNEEDKQTHIVSQSISKEKYDELRNAEKYPPTLGNLTDWSKLGGSSSESAPTQGSGGDFESTEDDLPF